MRRLLSIIVSLVTAISFAQQPVELPLWPDGAPNSSGLTGEEQETRPHFVTNVTHPTLTVYHPEKPNGMAIIMCPGGGYRGLGMDGEGYVMAPWFCGQGITYIVLKYRMPNGHWEVPVSDAEQAIRMVRQHAKEWNVNPYKVGLMGASAGGHLTATLATHYNSETRPDFQILLYPVVTMMQVTRGNTRTALLGNNGTNTEVFRRIASNARYSTSIYRSYLRRPFRSTLPRSKLLPCFTEKQGFGNSPCLSYRRTWLGISGSF